MSPSGHESDPRSSLSNEHNERVGGRGKIMDWIVLRRAARALRLAGFVALGACTHLPGQGTDLRRLADAMRSRPIVLLGEVHDNAEQHALRAQALRELLASGARPALLMEQFDRERQGDIDEAMARAGATADDVIEAAGAQGVGWAWPLYRPFISLALEYHLPLVAANVSRADARRVSQEGLAATGFDATVPAEITSYQTQTILASHCGMLNEAQAGRMATAQVARDQFMARLLNEHSARGAVLLAGNGHVRNDVGVPTWLSPAMRQRSVGIGLLENGETGAEAYDRVIATAAPAARPDPCDGMKRPAS
jgi:uncharacterized iron-regulated protein